MGIQLNHYTLAVKSNNHKCSNQCTNAMEDRNYLMMVHVKIVATTREPRKMVKNVDLTPAVIDNT